MPQAGQIIILNGAPRAGKSSLAASIQCRFDGPWINLGVDAWAAMTPPRFQPGIGLRPGGERPDLEPFVVAAYAALYGSIAAHSRAGLNVVADLGHHDHYSRPLHILPDAARRLAGLPVLFVGIHCPIETIMARRNAGQPGREGRYEQGSASEAVPPPVALWQQAVHEPGIYDLELDSSRLTPDQAADAIHLALTRASTPTAFERLATM